MTRADGRYGLTALGRRALEVMVGVEGGPPSSLGGVLGPRGQARAAALLGLVLLVAAAVVAYAPILVTLSSRPELRAVPVLDVAFGRDSGWYTCRATSEGLSHLGPGWVSPPCPTPQVERRDNELLLRANLSGPPDGLEVKTRWIVDLDVPRGPAPIVRCDAHIVRDFWSDRGKGRYERRHPLITVVEGGRRVYAAGDVVGVSEGVRVDRLCDLKAARGRPSYEEEAARSKKFLLRAYLWVSCEVEDPAGASQRIIESPSVQIAKVQIEEGLLEAQLRDLRFQLGEVRYERPLSEVYGGLKVPLAAAGVALVSLGVGLAARSRIRPEGWRGRPDRAARSEGAER